MASSTTGYCRSGLHDIAKVGRESGGGCRGCKRISNRKAARKYDASEKGRERRRRYAASEKGRDMKRRYEMSEKGRDVRLRRNLTRIYVGGETL